MATHPNKHTSEKELFIVLASLENIIQCNLTFNRDLYQVKLKLIKIFPQTIIYTYIISNTK